DYAALSDDDIEQLTGDRELARYFEAVVAAGGDAKPAANWLLGDVAALLKRDGRSIGQFSIAPRDLAALIALVGAGTISGTAAKQVLARMVETGRAPADIARDERLLKVGDDGALNAWIDRVLAEHPDEARRFVSGE